MTDFWKILAIAPTDDVKLVKRAYAARLKHVRPEDDPQGFQELRQAYEWALEYGVHGHTELFSPVNAEQYRLFEREPKISVVHKPHAVEVCLGEDFLTKPRPLEEFFQAFFQYAISTQSDHLVEKWVIEQPEWVSLVFRSTLEAELAENFSRSVWPWPAALAVARLLDWEFPRISALDAQMLRRARLQSKFSRAAKVGALDPVNQRLLAAHTLMRPLESWGRFKRPIGSVSPLVSSLFNEVLAERVAVDEVFDVGQVNVEMELQSLLLTPRRLFASWLPFLITGVFAATFVFAKGDFASVMFVAVIGLTMCALVLAKEARFSFHRLLWTHSLRVRPALKLRWVFPPLMLVVPVSLGVVSIISHVAMVIPCFPLSLWLLHSMQAPITKSLLFAFLFAVAITAVADCFLPAASGEFGYLGWRCFFVGLFLSSVYAWFEIRKTGIVHHLNQEFLLER